MKSLPFALVAVFALTMPSLAFAQTVLTRIVSSAENTQVETEFTRAELEALPQMTIITDNDYVEGETTFSGPLVRDLFGTDTIAPGQELVLTALNDYFVTIPASDVIEYDVILALSMDGVAMTARDKGPVWVIYPMTEHEELREASYNDRLIWQLRSVELK